MGYVDWPVWVLLMSSVQFLRAETIGSGVYCFLNVKADYCSCELIVRHPPQTDSRHGVK